MFEWYVEKYEKFSTSELKKEVNRLIDKRTNCTDSYTAFDLAEKRSACSAILDRRNRDKKSFSFAEEDYCFTGSVAQALDAYTESVSYSF